MKVWKRVKILKSDNNVDMISRSFINYIYRNGPINDLIQKYHIEAKDIMELNQYTANRIAGLLLLYFANDKKRLDDIILKYNSNHPFLREIEPEIEGYIEK